MGRPPGWAAALTGRAVMRSPGRPPVRRDLERAFWGKIAEGLTSEDAAMACGVSGPVGSRWFVTLAVCHRSDLTPVSGRCLYFPEREQIAVMRAEGVSMRMIADRIRAISVNDLAGVAAQRRHSQWEARISRVDRAVES